MSLINTHFIQLILKIATGFYGLALVAACLTDRRSNAICFRLVLLLALLLNATVVAIRYHQAWPMLPMYLGSAALPLCLGILTLFVPPEETGDGVRRIISGLTVLTAAAAVCFPKDFYLPFLKSQTLFAHLFFVFGVIGKGCFLAGAAWAVMGLGRRHGSGGVKGPATALTHSFRWTVWGFAFWTFSMFSGELWSYLGWGTPVVWDDPAITTTMATWFFYICLLHLHLTGTWTPRGRGAYAASGIPVVFCLNCIPDLGPFRWPF